MEQIPPRLKVSENRRFLLREDGTGFFYLGDTAWELFHRTTFEEAGFYLRDRAAKGFNVIQAVALAELDGLRVPNRYGHTPFLDLESLRPDESYWEYLDRVIRLANRLGLYVGLLPAWGDKWNRGRGAGPEILNARNAEEYGRWISSRYRGDAVIWILGGDRPLQGEHHLETMRALAAGIRENAPGQLMTLHPSGCRSSSWSVNAEPWLDFNMQQSDHGRSDVSLRHYRHDRELLPRRPFVNGEPPYEEHPAHFRMGDDGWIDQHDVRREFCWAICSGAAGFTYGAHPIWQFYDEGRVPVSEARMNWRQALQLPGAGQLRRILRLLPEAAVADRTPAENFLLSPAGTGVETITACRNNAGSWAWIYLPLARRLHLDPAIITSNRIGLRWIDPASGRTVRQSAEEAADCTWLVPPPNPGGQRDLLLELTAL